MKRYQHRHLPSARAEIVFALLAASLLSGCQTSPTSGNATVTTVGSVAVVPADSIVVVGEQTTLSVKVVDASGNPLSGLPVTWSSSDPSVAVLSGGGYTLTLTGVSAGSSVVTATVGSRAGSATVSILDPGPPPPPPSPVPAFPEAEGWGAMALNECRSFRLRVDRVTNTNDSGPGSLRDALYNLTDTRFQVILFETGGTIELSDRLELRNDCVYLAGQTAPGDGILLKGNGLRVFNTRDVVIRYVRIRDATNNLDITDTGGTRRIVVDHVSTTWGTDGNFGIWRTERSAPDTREITFQRSISAEVLAGHSAGFLIGGRGSERAHEGVYDISIHHNLFAHTGQRNPEVISGSAQERIDRGTEIVNNVQYNWLGRPISTRRNSVVDILNNFSKPGPMSAILVHRHAFYDSDLADVFADPSLFAQGNVMAGEHFADQWQMFRDWYALDETLPDRFRRTDPLPKAPFPVSVHSAEAAFESVLGDVGASARLDCDGNWIPAHDPIDLRILTDVLAGTGYSEAPPESPDEAGGWPIMSEGQRCQDSDSDGLPDQWEARFTPCPTCADPAAAGRDGYLWIEHYLNGSDPR